MISTPTLSSPPRLPGLKSARCESGAQKSGALDLEAAEPGRHHADDLERRAVDEHGPSQHVRIAIEAALPALVAQHDRPDCRQLRLVIGGAERAPHHRIHVDHLEEVARDEGDRHHPAVDTQIDVVHRRVGVREDARFPRNASNRGRVSSERAPSASRGRSTAYNRADVRDLIDAEQERVQDGEEHRHHAEADRNRHHNREGSQRRAPERAQGVLDVPPEFAQPRQATSRARLLAQLRQPAQFRRALLNAFSGDMPRRTFSSTAVARCASNSWSNRTQHFLIEEIQEARDDGVKERLHGLLRLQDPPDHA